jgi:pimeloyl-ACP methyl ester carboxylesterase
VTFDVNAIRCPVIVLHGGLDRMAKVVNAEHTAAIVPNAKLLVHPELGHFSIEDEVVPTIVRMLSSV